MAETEHAFILEHSETWRELESETQYFSKRMNRLRNRLSPSRLTRERVDHYIELYNTAANHLAYCRTFWGETETAQYLNRLVGSAHSVIYTKTVFSVKSIFAFLGKGFPKLFRAEFRFFLVSALAMFIPALIAFLYVRADLRNALAFMGEVDLESIRGEGDYDTFNAAISSINGLYIGSNNIIVCLEAFAGGLTLGLFTLYMLASNGLSLGALAGVAAVRGFRAFFWSLILPHGVTELFAIILSGAAGLMLGNAILRPGNVSRKNAIILAGKKALRFMAMAILFLIPSAIIESFFTPLDLPYAVKFIFSGAVFLALASYLCIGLRKEVREMAKRSGDGKGERQTGLCRLSALLLCAVLLLNFCGCTPGDRPPSPTEDTHIITEELTTMELYADGYNNNMIVGFDEYGRTVPAAAGKKEKRDVGIFYFLWLGQPQSTDIYDVSKIIAEHGQNIVFHEEGGSISPNGQAHWWAEPLYGYYNSADKWVLRKHMEMLTEAGVDFLIFDTTNCVLYEDVAKRIMKMSQELRDEGWDAPQVCFYTHSRSIETIKNIYNAFYKNGSWSDSWYRIDGRPMIIGYTSAKKDINEARGRGDNSYNPEDLPQDLQEFFYVKEACWPYDFHNANSFPYTEWTYPQPLNGNTMNVSVATHPMVPFSFSLTHENWCNWGRGYDVNTGENKHEDIYRGTFFQSEWETVFASDPQPEILMVTGWNEWIAYKQPYGGEYMLCDNVDMEYSRDIEPMQGGYEDAYFIQMLANIRKYKYESAESVIADNVYKTIDLAGPDSQWDEVKAVYRHVGTANDRRNAYGGAMTVHYSVPAADNNILTVRLTNDAENLYFRIECAEAVKVVDNAAWMNLFIGTGTPGMKGWESYEFVVGRSRDAAAGSATVERLAADFSGKRSGSAAYSVNGNTVVYSVPLSALGLGAADGSAFRIYFKVADGVDGAEEIMNYYVSGRVLPMGRLSYEYKFKLPETAN